MTKAPLVVDSSAWIEVLGGAPLAEACRKEIHAAPRVLVPTLVVYEVYRKIKTTHGEEHALQVIAMLSQHTVIDLTREIALHAADISLQHKLAMADSIMLAVALDHRALLLTLDNDFAALANVKVLRRA